MNTRIHYEYRDGANYRFDGSIVAAGELTPDLWRRIRGACDTGAEYGFIAHQIGFPEVFGYLPGPHISWLPLGEAPAYDEENDHCWHRLVDDPDAWELTSDAPTDGRTITELVAAFESTAKTGWRVFDPAKRFSL